MTRKPVQIFAIYIPKCANTFGTSPCTATLSASVPYKCFNLFGRQGRAGCCADPDNFDPSDTLTLYFSTNTSGLPKTEVIYPCMASEISGSSTLINVGKTDNRTGPFGRRETHTVVLNDFKDNDSQFDPYFTERADGTALFSGVGYDVYNQGRALSRFFARWPHWNGASCAILDGYQGDAIADMTKRNYQISGLKIDRAKRQFSIEITDILDLVSDTKLIPRPNDGQLDAGFDAEYTGAFDLSVSGAGDDYSASGRISIGSEIMTYTRSGDTFTIVSRAVDGTTAEDHSEGDTVQECWRTEGQPPDAIYADILSYADVDATFIPSATWADEVATWLPTMSMSRTIPKPTSVRTVGASLLTCAGLFTWWDRENQEVGLKANRFLLQGETPPVLDAEADFLNGSYTVEAREDQRITDVVFLHGLKDPSDSATDANNYNRALRLGDNSASSENEYGSSKYLTIYCPWFEDDTLAITVASRLLYRFRFAPDTITATLDISERPNLLPASAIDLIEGDEGSADGSSSVTRYQVTGSTPKGNNRVMVTLETYDVQGRFGVFTENTRSDYGASTDEEISLGTYWVDDATLVFPDGTGPYVWF